jgi:hypothetical protein
MKYPDLPEKEKIGAVCRICGMHLPVCKDKKLITCGSCHEKARVDGLEYMRYYSHNLNQPRVKFNVPKSTVEKRKWLAEVLNCSQGDIDNLAVSLLYDIFLVMPGKLETNPKGITELVARIRLSIIQEGILAQNRKVVENFNRELTDTTISGPPARGASIGGVQTGFRPKNR